MKSHEVNDVKTEATEAGLSFNRTGIMTNPELSAALIRGAKNTKPTSAGDDQQMATDREEYLNEGLPIGSAPVVVNGSEATGEEELSAEADRMSVLLDKLGERLAFERQGTRLYEAFLQKLEKTPVEYASGPIPRGLAPHLR